MSYREEVIWNICRSWPKYNEEDFLDMSSSELIEWVSSAFGQEGLSIIHVNQ